MDEYKIGFISMLLKEILTPTISLEACLKLEFIKRIDSSNSQKSTDFSEKSIFHNEVK